MNLPAYDEKASIQGENMSEFESVFQLADKANFPSGLKVTKVFAPECRLEECVVFVVCCLRFTAVTQSPERKDDFDCS
jgi:hypothetical protein